MRCLKRKRSWEHAIEALANYQLRIHDQVYMTLIFSIRSEVWEILVNALSSSFFLFGFYQILTLEGAKATTVTVDALRTGAASMKAMSKSM